MIDNVSAVFVEHGETDLIVLRELWEIFEVVFLDGVQHAVDVDDGGAVEVLGEGLGLERGGHADQAELGVEAQRLLGEDHREVAVEVALVDLVDDQVLDALERLVDAEQLQQDAGGEEGDALAGVGVEADRVAGGGTDLLAALGGDALGDGDGADAAGLRDEDRALGALALLDVMVEEVLRNLGRLAAAGRSGDDNDAVRLEVGEQLILDKGHGEARTTLSKLAHVFRRRVESTKLLFHSFSKSLTSNTRNKTHGEVRTKFQGGTIKFHFRSETTGLSFFIF